MIVLQYFKEVSDILSPLVYPGSYQEISQWIGTAEGINIIPELIVSEDIEVRRIGNKRVQGTEDSTDTPSWNNLLVHSCRFISGNIFRDWI